MSNDLELYHSILFTAQPWLDNTTTDQKYQQLLFSVSKENYAQQPLYELAFPRPLTPKRKYYHALIDNEARRYINLIHSLVNNALNEKEKMYWIHQTLTRKLKNKFEETEKRIASRQLFFSLIDDKQKDRSEKDNAYIIQLLKYELIRLYLEIQDSFPALLKEEPITKPNIHSLFFSEDPPEPSFIIQAPDYKLPKPSQPIVIQEEIKFLPIKADFVSVPPSILKYSELIRNPDKFALFETELFNQGIINQEYKFAKAHGQMLELAAAYRVLIKKKYFNDFYFPGKKKVTELHIRKFLNLRYTANIDREFRNFSDGKLLEQYLPLHPWLTLIIPS